ncbi:MAG: hypothetical protein WA919_01270 [Coleofasciculaceae cyanobacterium]
MKIKTLWHTAAVKEALLSLSDTELYSTIESWLHEIANQIGDTQVLDEIRLSLGYSLEAIEIGFCYRNWLEPAHLEVDFISPSPLKLRRLIEQMDLYDFYDQVIFIAGEALGGEEMGFPPCRFSNGYEFMENLVDYLRACYFPSVLPIGYQPEEDQVTYI